MTTTSGAATALQRRWRRSVLRAQGSLDSEGADRYLPWAAAALVFVVLLALDAAAQRSLEGGSGLTPWIQAAWRRQHGGGAPVAGVDPATGSWSFVAEPVLFLARWIPAGTLFAVVQAAALALALVPLWRLARDEAQLRVGATMAVTTAFALAPTLHRANLSAFHPEVIALPALLWAYLLGRQGHHKRYIALVLVVLACRADLGLTVAAMGALLLVLGRRKVGGLTVAAGLAWTVAAIVALDPSTPTRALTPSGEFVARVTTPLAVIGGLVTSPFDGLRELLAEPSVVFLVLVLAPLIFLPLVAPKTLAVALPGLVLAMVADRAVQRSAQRGVITLAPAGAHIAPVLAFVFVALIFALERIGERSVTRVNVDRRLLIALLCGASLLFVTEAPTSPYRQPWAWGNQDATDGARLAAADLVADDAAVAASPGVAVLVAARARLVELPPNPADLTDERIATVVRGVDVVLLDTNDRDDARGATFWTDAQRARVLAAFAARGLTPRYEAGGIYLLVPA